MTKNSIDNASNATVTITRGDVLWPESQERPTGLRDEDFQVPSVHLRDTYGWQHPSHDRMAMRDWQWYRIDKIAMPADTPLGIAQTHNLSHPKQTFNRVWHGGNAAPEDWDLCATLRANGDVETHTSARSHGWRQSPPLSFAGGSERRIIAYNARTEAPAQDKPTYDPERFVLVERMSEDEAREWCESLYDRMPNKMEMASHSWSRRWDAYRMIVPAVVRHLGIIRPESTLAEQITAIVPDVTDEQRRKIEALMEGERK